MTGEKESDPRANLVQSALGISTQIFCARGGETLGNRVYDQRDAVLDAAQLITLCNNEAWLKDAFSFAAEALGLPSIWPGDGEIKDKGSEPEAGFSRPG